MEETKKNNTKIDEKIEAKEEQELTSGRIVKQTKDIPATKDEVLCICVEDLTISLNKISGIKRYKSGEKIFLDRKVAEKLYFQNLIKYA